MIRCILFDRDGTLGELVDKRYPQSLVPYKNVKEIFTALKEKGYVVGVITNQSSIARGTSKDYDFNKEFADFGADLWEICPHDTKDGCGCRKPKSGLLLNACQRLHISPEECMVVGDRLTDIQCGKNVGAAAALVLTGNGQENKEQALALYPDIPVFESFEEIVKYLP